MPVTLSIQELQERLPDLLSRAAQGDEQYIVERDGAEYVVTIRARPWRSAPGGAEAHGGAQPDELVAVSSWLDELGPGYRFAAGKQERVEQLLARDGQLTPAERAELNGLLREADEILARRAHALNQTG